MPDDEQPTTPVNPPEQQPGWAAPPPEAAAGAPAVTSRKKTWLVVLISALVAIAVAAGAGTWLFVDRTLPVVEGADDFLADVSDGRTEDAQARLCRADREDAGADLVRVVRRLIERGDDEYNVNLLSVDRDDDTATVDFSVGDDIDDDDSYALPMRQEGGDWRACPGDELRNL